MSKLSIIMYHYVRELPYTRYPAINGLLVSEFREQLDYMQQYYHFATVEECLHELAEGSGDLPDNSILLTFDDAYIDHYTSVFPLLDERGIQGVFFPPAKAIMKHEVLGVNKIHFVMASIRDPAVAKGEVFAELDANRDEYGLESNESYYRQYANLGRDRRDGEDANFIKRILQMAIDEELRTKILDKLFCKYVSEDERAFSRELYMDVDQLKCLARNGMYIGSHGYDHYWLGLLAEERMQVEIEQSLAFLADLGCDLDNWVMCYPYGNYSEQLLHVLREKKCKMAVTTEVDVATMNPNNRLVLPRLDTNDLPKDGAAVANEWTQKVI
jgi:peptidoglycan/xylan/chitin deacetylase (PgdA/CDA1 family)